MSTPMSESSTDIALRLPNILERIAYLTLTLPSGQQHPGNGHADEPPNTFYGPPRGLTALLLVSRAWYDALSFGTCPRLYARLFCFKFDVSAARRRFSSRWRSTRCLAIEFKRRIETLRRLRIWQQPILQPLVNLEDLWVSYIMYVVW
jgi:hypothetical protein